MVITITVHRATVVPVALFLISGTAAVLLKCGKGEKLTTSPASGLSNVDERVRLHYRK